MPGLRSALILSVGMFALIGVPLGIARADQQRDPKLKRLLQKILGDTDCFVDKYESEVRYRTMEPRLRSFVLPLIEVQS